MCAAPALTNEADVREDFIVPLLNTLGYRRGTRFDILREKNLIYPRNFIGRKKRTDPPLVGKADYILSVVGHGKWVIEAKPPTGSIGRDEIEQALTYARHPEVSATLVVVTNGSQTHIYNSMASYDDGPLGVIEEVDPIALANLLSGLVKPKAFEARFTSKIGPLVGGIAPGYPSQCEIIAGTATYQDIDWKTNIPFPPMAVQQLRHLKDSLQGFVSHISEGQISTKEDGLQVTTKWFMGNNKMEAMAESIGLARPFNFTSPSLSISTDSNVPTYFDTVVDFAISPGDQIISNAFGQWLPAGIAMTTKLAARGKGYLDGVHFRGDFFTEYYFEFPQFPEFQMYSEGYGDFSVRLDV